MKQNPLNMMPNNEEQSKTGTGGEQVEAVVKR